MSMAGRSGIATTLGLSVWACALMSGCGGAAASTQRAMEPSPGPAMAGGQAAPGGSAEGTRKRLIARTADVGIYHDDPEVAVEATTELAKRAGGWVQASSHEHVEMRVPDEKLEEVMAEMAKLGEVWSRQISGRDVTEQFFDTQLRLENLERIRLRYLALLDKATSVKEALPVEQQLERVTLEIEQLKGKLTYLKSITSFATVRVDFEPEITPGPLGWVFYGLYRGVKWLFVWD